MVRERDGSKRASKWAYLWAEVFKETLVGEPEQRTEKASGKGERGEKMPSESCVGRPESEGQASLPR